MEVVKVMVCNFAVGKTWKTVTLRRLIAELQEVRTVCSTKEGMMGTYGAGICV